ncbi:hypothetical protein G5S52_08380 [Grimontia sp. S25]|uniref:Uncharacterized protein n=1 Tax=Grimontia sedimenti TaxID=2711294 RepID=A0A6M1RBV4_9GAMM|nr:hypothetical protein [Grimontia sedimenti]NGN97686.1 hypothetical protein [Grimontia sedimenti]
MLNEVKFCCTPNFAGESEGLGDAGIETFLDSPFISLAREIGQNSRDAKSPNVSCPVRITFDILEVEKSEIPGINEFINTVEQCLETSYSRKDPKAIDFFYNLSNLLKKESVKILKIEDINTKGLHGPCEEGTPFHSLVKSRGVSQKGDDISSGGSHGIGKNAVYAVSQGRTVFYSTKYLSNSEEKFYFQGKSLLISHCLNHEPKSATGYWGEDQYKAIENIELLPKWLHKEEQGTTIFSLFFEDSDRWEDKIVISLINNFTSAIYNGEMEFNINNEYIVNRESISNLIFSSDLEIIAERSGIAVDLEVARQIYKCLSSDLSDNLQFEIKNLGKFNLRILLDDEASKKYIFFVMECLSHQT